MKLRKALACILCAAMVSTTLTGCSMGNDNNKVSVNDNNNITYKNVEDEILMEVVSKVVNAGSSNAKKEETVYVKTDASGSVNSVVVSNWLKNMDNTEELIDYTQLTDITNIKGKETYTEEAGKITWSTEGNDIYYQGTTDKELPVDVNISYNLDGKTIAASELDGKDGHLKITINYINNSVSKVSIGDREEDIYTPFAVVSGMMLDNEKVTNVSVTNGTVISDGKREIVVGMAFPGLVDSLNGQKVEDDTVLTKLEDNISIPSDVVIEADVTNFESSMILTMVSSDIIGALGLDNVDADMDLTSVKDSVNEFTDAGNKLAEGTGQLRDGVTKLSSGTTDLVTGTAKLHDGVVAYTNGVGQVADGASKLDDGASRLDSGAGDLQNGINAVDSGVSELKNGIDNVNSGAGSLYDGVIQVDDGAKAVATGATQVSDGVNTLTEKMEQIAQGVGTASQAASQISGGINQVVEAVLSTTNASDIDTSSITISGCIDGNSAAAIFSGNIPTDSLDSLGLTDEQKNAVMQIMSGVASQVIPSVADTAATGAARQAAATAAANAANTAKSQVKSALVDTGLQAGASSLATSLGESYVTLTSAESQEQLNALKTGASQVASGASTLAGGTENLKNGAKQLSDGTKQLSDGATTLKNGTTQLSDGVTTLKNGTSELKAGTSTLVNGTNELNSNSAALIDGSKTLADGSVTLVDGINQLLMGAIELDNGMVKFNDEGISKLTELFDTDVNSMSNRIKAISEAGKAYKSFGGSSEDEDSRVRFVIESV